ncbi:LPXTG-motif cell wall-anchored protein [Caldalkalibacillus uzonensis]|uniref:LPXTG-motif cell wall-anchored protein n=1 Tax=Caldalkalibacillus uzonensis TaxID=353224 RepID=A0ABU0CQS6_9BACI|nr:copper resistance protein CopC [Caldalkalibacillus uzonensis]MDQ0338487.1 LPXTG-motif cell wall-anchored protein [Caldalkalibacillus uzonensis]
MFNKTVPIKQRRLSGCFVLILILSLCGLSLFYGPPVKAHTYLESSTPADGETVEEEIQSVELTFDTQVQDVIKVEIISDANNVIDIDKLQYDGRQVIAFLPHTLDNGHYTVNWEIVSEDGHITNGAFSFTVEADMPESPEEGTSADDPDTTETTEESAGPEADEQVAPDGEGTLEEDVQQNEVDQNNSFLPWLGLVLVVIAVVGYVLWRKRS